MASRDDARRLIFNAQNGACSLCRGQMTLDRADKHMFATFEHTLPKARGGKGVPRTSLPLAHKLCNSIKGDDTTMRYFVRRDVGAPALQPPKPKRAPSRYGGIPFTWSWLVAHGYIEAP